MAGHPSSRPLIRKAPLQRFSYVIAFEKHDRHVRVLAVAHATRRPLYWLTRTNRPSLLAGPPPPALAVLQSRHRSIRQIHPVLAERREVPNQGADELIDDGWIS